jgi:chromosome segregation ATPase
MAKDRCAAALKEARQLTGVQSIDRLPEEVQEKLAELPDTVGEVDEAIHTCNARIQLMGRGDSKVLEDYMNRCRRIEELSEKIHSINTETAELKQNM